MVVKNLMWFQTAKHFRSSDITFDEERFSIRNIGKYRTGWLIDFNGLSSRLGLFCAMMFGHCGYRRFILIYFMYLFFDGFLLHMILSNTNNFKENYLANRWDPKRNTHSVKVDPGVLPMKEYFTLHISPGLEPCNQMKFSIIPRILFYGEDLPFYRGKSQRILSHIDCAGNTWISANLPK